MRTRLLCSVAVLLLLLSPSLWAAPRQDLVVALESAPKTLDPRFAVDANGMRLVQQLLYDMLVTWDHDLNIVPSLAQHWEKKSPTTYLFYLKPNVLFHNGTPLRASDVEFTFNTIMNPETASPFKGISKKIKSVLALDALTVRIETQTPIPESSLMLDLFIPIFQKNDHIETVSDLVGTGPFRLIKQSPSEIILEHNTDYHEGTPPLKTIVFKIIKDDKTRYLKFRKGKIDFASNTIAIKDLKHFRSGVLKKNFRMIEAPAMFYRYLGFNMEHPILRNKNVRQAIAHAINRDELIQFIKKNHASKADSVLTQSNPYYAQGLPQYEYDPERSKQLLDDAGYPMKKQERFALEYKTSTNKERIRLGRIIKEQLSKIGITLHIRTFEWGTFFADVKTANFDLYALQWVGVSEPDFFYTLFHSTQFPPEGKNRVRYQNPELDSLLESGRGELDTQKRKLIYHKVQKILASELPYISLWYNNNIVLLRKSLKGFKIHPTGGYHSFKSMSY